MRIVHFAPGWPPNVMRNGIVSSLGVLAPALRARGCDVEILAMRGEPSPGEEHVTYVPRAAPPDRESPIARAIRTRLSSDEYRFGQIAKRITKAILNTESLSAADLLYIEESFGWYHAIAKRLDMPVVVALHGPWFMNGAAQKEGGLDNTDALRIRLEGAGLAGADGVTAPSQFVLDAVRRRYGLELPDATVIRNPVTLVPAERCWSVERADRDEMLFIGRFDRHKGADILLRAFGIVAANRPSAKLTFAGTVNIPIEVGGKLYQPDEYIRSIMPPDCANRISFLGHVPFDQLGDLRRRAFVTVVASRFENLPSVLLEAMAHGSPVVAAAAGGIPEVATDGVNAILARPEDAEDLARGMERLLDDPALAAALGSAGRAHIETHYAPGHIAEIVEAYFQALLARRKTTAVR
ncbi:MAG: glycosyltransferase family 4 protein [Amphiplicatus sp.]